MLPFLEYWQLLTDTGEIFLEIIYFYSNKGYELNLRRSGGKITRQTGGENRRDYIGNTNSSKESLHLKDLTPASGLSIFGI